jgi:hypothetical protein
MLINAVETADAQGFPSFWDKPEAHHPTPTNFHAESTPVRPSKPQTSVIGWHPLD